MSANIRGLQLAVANRISLSTTKKIISQCIRSYLQSFIVSKDHNGSNLLEKRNVDPGRPCTHQSLQEDTDKAIIGTGNFCSGSIDFDDRYDASIHRYERIHHRENIISLPSSWPTITLHAKFDNGTSADALSPSARPPLAVSNEPLKQRFGQSPNTGQKHAKGSPDSVFRPMEDYIIRYLRSCDNLNQSFRLFKPSAPLRSVSEDTMTASHQKSQTPESYKREEDIFEMDGKTLLLGDVAENGGSSCLHRLKKSRH